MKKPIIVFCGTPIFENSFPIIVTAKDKHSDMQYIAMNVEGLKKIALDILKFRKQHCDCYLPISENLEDNFEDYFYNKNNIKVCDFDEIVIEMGELANKSFIEGGVKYSNYIQHMKKQFEESQRIQKIHQYANQSLDEENTDLALKVLRATMYNEYEGIVVDTQIKIYE